MFCTWGHAHAMEQKATATSTVVLIPPPRVRRQWCGTHDNASHIDHSNVTFAPEACSTLLRASASSFLRPFFTTAGAPSTWRAQTQAQASVTCARL